ncbi:MAG: CapA family protein [Ferruginibacter sp.]
MANGFKWVFANIFSKYNITIPHSASGIAEKILKIDVSEVKKGDFLFFKGKDINSSAAEHVCMVIEVNKNILSIMHSCDREIIVEQYPSIDYYNKRFLFAGRLPLLNLTTKEIDTSNFPHSLNNLTGVSKDTLSIIGVGDMMLGSNYPSNSYLPPHDGKDILAPVKDILIDANITFGNMEGALLTGSGNVKKCNDPSVCYAFKSPNHYISYFKDAGFDVVSLANNHSGDFGAPGKLNTVKLLKENNIEFAGLTEYPFTIFEKDGIKYGFCAFAPNNGTIDINDQKNAVRLVHKLDSLCDVVIVSFHGGAEGAKHTHITRRNEIFMGENRGNPFKFSRDVIDAGADIVFGHGPHVTRAIDIYKGRFIAYSLGNFATYGRFNLSGVSGIAPIVKVFVDKKGKFIYGQIFSIIQVGEGGPVVDTEQNALSEIIRLTKSDVPESSLIIEKNGLIYHKHE